MFQRVLVEEWATWVPFISFFLIAGVFAAVTIRAIRIGKPDRERLASMPLEDPQPPEHP